jgi:hypothetical protein
VGTIAEEKVMSPQLDFAGGPFLAFIDPAC